MTCVCQSKFCYMCGKLASYGHFGGSSCRLQDPASKMSLEEKIEEAIDQVIIDLKL